MWGALGKYRKIVVSIALFLIFDASVLILNFYISFKIGEDAVGVNLAGRQRMLSQRMVKTLYEIEAAEPGSPVYEKALNELRLSYGLFNTTLTAFDEGGATTGSDGNPARLKQVTSPGSIAAVAAAKEIWQPYNELILAVIAPGEPQSRVDPLREATAMGSAVNLQLLKLMNDLTTDLEFVARSQAETLRYIQTGGITLAIINFMIILFHFVGELRKNDRELEAAREETTEILNTVNEGLFLLDKDLRLGSQHSARLPELFGGKEVANVRFSELIGDIVKPKDLETAKRFVGLLFKPNVKGSLIKDLNPLNEVEVRIPDGEGGYIQRFLNFDFSKVQQKGQEETVLVTVIDVTRSVQLAAELAQTKAKNEQQLEMLTSILHTDPKTLKRFMQGAFDTFAQINDLMRDQSKSDHAVRKKLRDIFVEVHNFKGDASALELETFASLAHEFENDIQVLQEKRNITGNDLLKLTIHLENLMRYSESVQEIAEKLSSFSIVSKDQQGDVQPEPKAQKSEWSHLLQLCESVAQRENKSVQLVMTGFNETKIPDAMQPLINDVTIQLIRNSIVHSVEGADVRKQKKKPAMARIDARLVVLPQGNVELSVRDDGNGIDYEKIRRRAMEKDDWDADEVKSWDQKKLLSLIFEPGFSTADQVGADAGRGVGMDVIRSRIQNANGRLSISSRSGSNCQFTITLPMSQRETIAA